MALPVRVPRGDDGGLLLLVGWASSCGDLGDLGEDDDRDPEEIFLSLKPKKLKVTELRAVRPIRA